MSTDYVVEPMGNAWPKNQPTRTHAERVRGPFKATWWRTEALLARELRYLRAQDVVLMADVADPARDIRIDGKLRSDARVTSPRVLLSFTDDKGNRYHYAADRYRDWQANLHAVALTLEALRAVERYGAVSGGQQYVGFKALPHGGSTADANGAPPPVMTLDEAAAELAKWYEVPARVIASERSVAALAVASAKRKSHPESGFPGASAEAFVRVSEAERTLAARHGGAL